jgi:hypothetical protein
MSTVQEYVRLHETQKTLEAQLKIVKGDKAKIEESLLDQFAEDGVQNIKTSDGKTVYVLRQLWASKDEGVSDEEATEALEEAGLDEYVRTTFNASQLSSWVREQDKLEEPLPKSFEGVIRVAEKFSLRVTKS